MSQIMPAFLRYPAEAAIIGRLLAGYGELEFLLHLLLSEAVGDQSTSGRLMFRSRSEEHRLSTADALIRPMLEQHSLIEPWDRVRRAVFWCKTTRNQYAHCHWLADDDHGLMFTHIEKAAKSLNGQLKLEFFHVDVPLLERIEAYFHYADVGLGYLRAEVRSRKAGGDQPSHPWPRGRCAHPGPGRFCLESARTTPESPPDR